MIVIGCSRGEKLGKSIASKINAEYSSLTVKKFPDNESYVKFQKSLIGKDVLLVQSFFPDVNDCMMEILFAAYTARDLGARKIKLAASYFPYFRQDKRFNEGECVSIDVIAKLIDSIIDEFIVITPHLHRRKSLDDVFKTRTKLLTTEGLIADYIKKKIGRDYVLVGPDGESSQWVAKLAAKLNMSYVIFNKERFSATKVKVDASNGNGLKGKKVIMLDDMVSTGNTMIQAATKLKKTGVKKIMFICTHGLFLNGSLDKLKKHGELITTNTIESKYSKIDVSGLIASVLR